jgi:hypothetical protein
MTLLPKVVTHNYDPVRGKCRNLCYLPRSEAEAILDQIRISGTRRIKACYLKRRIAVEDWLICERRKKLGDTRLERPIYFFLGDFADGKDPSRPASLVMPLAAFAPETLTFTYPDSMASLPIATRDEHAFHRKDYHGQVFTLSEIERVVARFGLPEEQWKTDPTRTYDRFIEVQVWDDRPIERYLSNGGLA